MSNNYDHDDGDDNDDNVKWKNTQGCAVKWAFSDFCVQAE